jgi:phage tail sheath protein FI
MTEPVFGITFQRDDHEPRPVIGADMSVVGLVGTAPEADADDFPLNTPVLMSSSDPDMLIALGLAGTLPDALTAINAQLGAFQVAAKVVVVRVAEGGSVEQTLANLIGVEASQTGIFALLKAGPELAVIPRLVAVPGYTHQRYGGIASIAITDGGQDYTTAPAVQFNGGTPIRAAAATATVAGGVVTAITITDPGLYLTAPTVQFTGGGGTDAAATATLETLANPVCAALPSVLNRLLAHAVVEGPGTNATAIKDWRETLSSDRLIPVDAWTRVQEGVSVVTNPGAAGVIGIGVRRDFEKRGVPSHSWANQPMQGILGPARDVNFSLTDGATEGQDLLLNNIGILVRGELGVESAIASSGFIFVGTDNAGDDPIWQFYNVTRMRDYIHLGLLRTLRFYLGKYNITGQTIEAILNTTRFFLRDLIADGHILAGARIGFEKDKNSPENLRLGKFRLYFAAEEPPVLRRIDIDSRRNRASLDLMLDELITRANELIA